MVGTNIWPSQAAQAEILSWRIQAGLEAAAEKAAVEVVKNGVVRPTGTLRDIYPAHSQSERVERQAS